MKSENSKYKIMISDFLISKNKMNRKYFNLIINQLSLNHGGQGKAPLILQPAQCRRETAG
jgi:hypothetical protein